MRTSLIILAALVAVATATTGSRPAFNWTLGDNKHSGQLSEVSGGWPQCDPGVKQMSGYFDIDADTDKHYFYWAFEAKVNPETAPVILWMTGGPGCSSGLAVLAENGPCHMNETTGQLYKNPHSWNNIATVIYIDQPAGVGYSYADKAGYDHNETEVGNDLYKFMEAFYKQNPKFMNNDFFVYGESYGGHYAPATAHRIWQGNQAKEGPIIPLKGLSIGNGMTMPSIQFQYYSHLSYQWCKTVKGAPCISEQAYNGMVQATPQCVELAKKCQNAPLENKECATAMDFCSSTQMGPFEQSGLNVYDIRIPCKVPGLCYNFTATTNWFNSAAVKTALGARPQSVWATCDMKVNSMFGEDWMRQFETEIPDLLASNIRVLIYAGDVDFICNWLGNKAWTLSMPWAQQPQFAAAQDLPWYVNELPAGRFRTVSKGSTNMLFTFLQVHGAGHMVPMNQPERALLMVKHFITDTPFYGWGGI
jgi:cathepsin A (carboxypeptidase C)